MTDAAAQIVLSGLGTQFSKGEDVDTTLRANQDRINLSVLITRGNTGAVFNPAAGETFFDIDTSPANTEWATDINNPGETILATNYAALDFDAWIVAYGGQFAAGGNTVGRNAVLHIIPEDIYLNLLFTQWSIGRDGGLGGFTYQRSKTPDGDYNEDGVVNAADYTVWRDTLGQSVALVGAGADGDLSGAIDQGDYDFWAAVFGEVVNTVDLPSGSAAGASGLTTGGAVPEPATMGLLIVATATLAIGITARIRA